LAFAVIEMIFRKVGVNFDGGILEDARALGRLLEGIKNYVQAAVSGQSEPEETVDEPPPPPEKTTSIFVPHLPLDPG